MSSIKRNLEDSGTLYLNKFWSVFNYNRNPLFTPVSAMGVQLIARQDTLFGGENMEISPKMTLRRRYGHSRYCSASLNAGEVVLMYYSFKNLAGVINTMIDTNQRVAWFTPTTITTVKTKTTTQQGSFATVQNTLYYVDGQAVDMFKWDGTTVSNWGIAAPTAAPSWTANSGSLSPTVGYTWAHRYTNGVHVSTMSPPSANTGVQTSKEYTIGVVASTDPQVTGIQIYRIDDGGTEWYLETTVANLTTLSAWTDSMGDSYVPGGINGLIVAPIAYSNNPPPSNLNLLCWYAGRLFGAVGNVSYYAAGPDTTNGVGSESWPPLNCSVCPGASRASLRVQPV